MNLVWKHKCNQWHSKQSHQSRGWVDSGSFIRWTNSHWALWEQRRLIKSTDLIFIHTTTSGSQHKRDISWIFYFITSEPEHLNGGMLCQETSPETNPRLVWSLFWLTVWKWQFVFVKEILHPGTKIQSFTNLCSIILSYRAQMFNYLTFCIQLKAFPTLNKIW